MGAIERILVAMSTDWPPSGFDPDTGELMDEPEAVSNVAEFSVSEISNALKRTLEDTLAMCGCGVNWAVCRGLRPATFIWT